MAENGVGGYRPLAKFTQADVLLQKNDLKGAAAKFAEIAADTGAAQPFRDLATSGVVVWIGRDDLRAKLCRRPVHCLQ